MVSVYNEYSASSNGQLPHSKKRRFTEGEYEHGEYGYSDSESDMESDDDCQLEYEYYDARGEPILSTVIRPTYRPITPEPEPEPEPIKIVDMEELEYTNLSTGEVCPAKFVEIPGVSWDGAMKAHKKWLKEKEEAENKRKREILEAEMEKKRLDAIVASLPKFSTAMLARMAKEEAVEKEPEAKASSKFYSGGGASSTSHSAWGHKRNGGKKKAKVTLVAAAGQLSNRSIQNIRDDKYKKLVMNANTEAAKLRSERRLARKAKEDKEEDEGRLRMLKAVEEHKKKEAERRAALAAQVVETDAQKRERERMEEMRRIVQSKVIHKINLDKIEIKEDTKPDIDSVPDLRVKVSPEKKVAPRVEKRLTAAEELTNLFYQPDVKLCVSVVRGYPCKFGDRCKFSHVKPSRTNADESQVTRTRLCMSAKNGSKCKHGASRCKFAHNMEELSLMKCRFGARCRSVKLDKGTNEWENLDKGRICEFYHPGEDIDRRALCVRLGMRPELICRQTRYQPEITPRPVSSVVSVEGSYASKI